MKWHVVKTHEEYYLANSPLAEAKFTTDEKKAWHFANQDDAWQMVQHYNLKNAKVHIVKPFQLQPA